MVSFIRGNDRRHHAGAGTQPRPWLHHLVTTLLFFFAMPQAEPGTPCTHPRGSLGGAVAAAGVFPPGTVMVSSMMDRRKRRRKTLDGGLRPPALPLTPRVVMRIIVNRDQALEELNLDWTAENNGSSCAKTRTPPSVSSHPWQAATCWTEPRARNIRRVTSRMMK